MNKQQLASKIWASANKMRGNIEASEYKDYILGFIFYKFLSEKEEKYLRDDGWTPEDISQLAEDDPDTVRYVQQNIGFFIAYENLFSTWLKNKTNFDVSNVTDALSAFDRLIDNNYSKVFKDVFKTLQTGLDKLGDNSGSRTKAIRGLITLIKDIPMDAKQDYDVLGFIYEYLISNFASNAGKKAGEFYTPHEVSLLMSEIVANHLKNRNEIEIYDPTSGSGSLLINIGKCVAKQMSCQDNIKYYAQEKIAATYNLTRMNLVMRGILPSNIITRCGDTLDKDWPFFDENNTYKALYVDAVVSNPPYSQPWDPDAHQGDVRYARFGYAPKSKADYAFLLHDLYHVKPDGIMTIVLPHGVLFRGGEEETIRTQLIENDHIETIIGLPSNIFFGTGIPTIIMVLKQKREASDVLFIDASKHFIKEGKNNKLQASDIRRILDSIIERKNDPKFNKFSRLVSKEEIKSNGYNLNIPRYVDSSEEGESFDLFATMFGGIPNEEIDKLNPFFEVFPSLKKVLFRPDDDKPYSTLAVKDITNSINGNSDVISFEQRFGETFSSFDKYLERLLLANPAEVEINKSENIIANEIFGRLGAYPIIDKYQAYEFLDYQYKIISTDLEMIQTEGLNAIAQVDPNMVIKKKGNEEHEEQDGWIGHIIPFEIVQKTKLKSEYDKIINLSTQIESIDGEMAEMLENLSEDDKETIKDLINEDGDAFIPKEVKAFVKPLIKSKEKFANDSVEALVIHLNELIDSEKSLKKDIKVQQVDLEKKTKTTIESLTKEEQIELLKEKWILPLTAKILSLPSKIVKVLSSKVTGLASKYESTMDDLSKEISSNETQLSTMIDDLSGSEFDIKGLKELQKLLRGDKNE